MHSSSVAGKVEERKSKEVTEKHKIEEDCKKKRK